MEQTTNKVVKPRRTIVQIRALLHEFEKGKIGVAEFCFTHNICRATFHKWRSRYRILYANRNKPSGFAALKVTSSPGLASSTLFAEVQGIKIYQPVAACYLKELISL